MQPMGRSVTALWLVPEQRGWPTGVTLSAEESRWAQGMAAGREGQFRRSRAWMRCCLADLFDLDPAAVPLQAAPGVPPTLPVGWGCLSLSHCRDAVAVIWSDRAVGIDVERSDRNFPAAALAARFYSGPDQHALKPLAGEPLRQAVLRQWVAKEALIKLTQGSLALDLGRWICGSDDDVAHHPSLANPVPVQRFAWDAWVLAVAGVRGQISPLCLI